MHFCSQEKETGALLFSRRRELVYLALLFSGYEKKTGALLFSG